MKTEKNRKKYLKAFDTVMYPAFGGAMLLTGICQFLGYLYTSNDSLLLVWGICFGVVGILFLRFSFKQRLSEQNED